MSNTVHPIAMTTALLCGARELVPETEDAKQIANLASRIHRCGMAMRRALGKNNGTDDPAKLAKAAKRADDWRLSLNVSLEDFGCTLIKTGVANMALQVPGMKHPHGIC